MYVEKGTRISIKTNKDVAYKGVVTDIIINKQLNNLLPIICISERDIYDNDLGNVMISTNSIKELSIEEPEVKEN